MCHLVDSKSKTEDIEFAGAAAGWEARSGSINSDLLFVYS